MPSRTLFPTSPRMDGLVARKRGVTSKTESSSSFSSTISLKSGEIVLLLGGLESDVWELTGSGRCGVDAAIVSS